MAVGEYYDDFSPVTDDEVIAAASSDPDAKPLTKDELARFRRVSPVKTPEDLLALSNGAEVSRTPAGIGDGARLPVDDPGEAQTATGCRGRLAPARHCAPGTGRP